MKLTFPGPLGAALLALTIAVTAQAQSTTGSILGDVQDASGARLPGATIRVMNEQTGATRETITNELGSFQFAALPPSDYSLTAELTGFATLTKKNIRLPLSSQIKIDFTLEVASASETVTVTEEAPLVETTENAVKTLIDSQRIQELPLKSRDFLDLAMLAPGVVSDQASAATGQTDSISFGGMSEGNKSIWLEGIDFNDEVTGGGTGISSATRTSIAQEAIQEFQVMANNYSSEFGRSGSGVINIVTKSGGNELHGNAFFFRRDDAFDKPNYFAQDVQPFTTNQWGGTVGGPIQKGSKFFFFSYERRTDDRSVSLTIPSQLVNFARSLGYDTRTDIPQTRGVHNYVGKITMNLTSAHTLNVMYLYDKRLYTNVDSGGTRSGDSGYNEPRLSYFVVGNLTSLLGQNTVNEFRFNRSIQKLDRIGVNRVLPELRFPTISFGADPTQIRSQYNWIVSDTVSRHFVGLGEHDFKFGGDFNWVEVTSRLNQQEAGLFEFLQDRPVVPGDASSLPFRYTQGITLPCTPERQTYVKECGTLAALNRSINKAAWFVNDTWRVRSNLTFNMGLRYDITWLKGDLNGKDIPDNINESDFFTRLIFGDLRGQNFKPHPSPQQNWSPRWGFAWDPFSDKKMSVHGGYGIYYDRITTNSLRTIVAGYPGYVTTAIGNDSRTAPNLPNSFFPNRPPTGLLSERGANSFIMPSRTGAYPYTQQYAFGVNRQLADEYAFSADYIYMFGLHFSRNYNLNGRLPNGSFPLIAAGTRMQQTDYGNTYRIRMLQLRLQKRFSNKLGFLFGYTAGRALGYSTAPVSDYDLNADLGPLPNDVRHRIVSNFIYELPYKVQFGGVLTWNTAAPYNITTGADNNRDGQNTDRPAGVGFNSGRGDSFFTLDLRASKKFAIRERMNIEVLWEMFNMFNTVNFTSYNGNRASSTFGQPRVALDPFQAQLGFKFTF